MTKAPLNILKRIAATVSFGFLVFSVSAQQTPQFSQFMFNNLAINPAYAGAEEALSLTLLHRSQWTGVDNAPSTQSFSAHTLVKKKHIGLGLTIIRDQIGVHKNTNALTNYAYHIKTGKRSFFSMGLQLGVTNLQSDYQSLTGIGNDPKLANSVNETMIDFGAGIYFRSPHFHIGLSAPGLISRTVQLNDSVSINYRRANVLGYSRYRFAVNDAFEMEPGILVKYFPDLPISYDINWNVVYKKALTVGVSYRKSESVDLILKFQLTTQLQFGYSYDYPVNDAARLSSASHEFMINYLFKNVKKRIASPR